MALLINTACVATTTCNLVRPEILARLIHASRGSNLPAGKTGRHIIYSVWTRSDSAETFYNCSDVVFDGGIRVVSAKPVFAPVSMIDVFAIMLTPSGAFIRSEKKELDSSYP